MAESDSTRPIREEAASRSVAAAAEEESASRSELETVMHGEVESITTTTEPSINNTSRSSPVETARKAYGCRCFPHGFYVTIPQILSTFGWITLLTTDGCDYARLTGPIVAEITDNPNIPYLEIGFFQYRESSLYNNEEWYIDYHTSCYDYNIDVVNIDGAWTFAKITAFLGLIFGGAGSLFLWFASCFPYSKTTWQWAGYELLFATIMQLISYTWFSTSLCHGSNGQDKCTLSYGSKADIVTISCWLSSVFAIFARFPIPRRHSDRGNDSLAISIDVEMTPSSRDDDLLPETLPQLHDTASTPGQSHIPAIS